MKQTATKPVSISQQGDIWTRVKRKAPNEKSVIDYIITTEQIAEQMQEVNVDQNGLYRLKGRVESDHNTIVLTANLNMWKEKEKT